MWSYDNGSSRRNRDNPPSSSRRYYGNVYDQPYYDAPPASSAAYDRHRRKSVPVNSTLDDSRHARRANVVASDDGFEKPYGGSSSRDPFVGASRHDVETKTSDRNRQFRDKRGTYETDEGQSLRRAKSYSPGSAARETDAPLRTSTEAPPRSGWQEADYATPARRPSTKSRDQQYYGEEPWAGQSRSRGRAQTAYEYGSGSTGMPAPPMGDYPPYKSSPMASSRALDEKAGKPSRGREKPYYEGYGSYPEPEPPRRERRSKHAEDRPSWEDEGYAPKPRGKYRAAPPDYDDDPYASAPRPRHRQSLPPQPRMRYEDPSEDPYGPPRRRATSASHGAYGGYNDTRERRYQDDDGYAQPRSGGGSYGGAAGAPAGGSSGRKKEKSKTIGKQAGKLFMTHAFPVIKQEAVPFLTKAAQAYFESSRK